MKNIKINLFYITFLLFITLFYSCAKEPETKKNQPLTEDQVWQKLAEFEKQNNIVTINSTPGIEVESRADDELCTMAYAQQCGLTNFTIQTTIINYLGCPVTVTYKKWLCIIPNVGAFITIQVTHWKVNMGDVDCRNLVSVIEGLYYGGLPASATEKINEIIKFFSNQILDVQAGWLAQILNSNCSEPVVNGSIVAVDCHKVCIDKLYNEEDDTYEFGSIFEKKCAISCCSRTKSYCWENGQLVILNDNVIGLGCARVLLPQPCDETPGPCVSACFRL